MADVWICSKCKGWTWRQKLKCHSCGAERPSGVRFVARPEQATSDRASSRDGSERSSGSRGARGRGDGKPDGDKRGGGAKGRSQSKRRQAKVDQLKEQLAQREKELAALKQGSSSAASKGTSSQEKEVTFREDDSIISPSLEADEEPSEQLAQLRQQRDKLQVAIDALAALPGQDAVAESYRVAKAKLDKDIAAHETAGKPLWALERKHSEKKQRLQRSITKAKARIEEIGTELTSLGEERGKLQQEIQEKQREIATIDVELEGLARQRWATGKAGLAAHLDAVPAELRATPELQRVDGLLTQVYSVATEAARARLQHGVAVKDEAATREELLAGQNVVESEKQFFRLFDEFKTRFTQVSRLSHEAAHELARLQAQRTCTSTPTVSITKTVAAADGATAAAGSGGAPASEGALMAQAAEEAQRAASEATAQSDAAQRVDAAMAAVEEAARLAAAASGEAAAGAGEALDTTWSGKWADLEGDAILGDPDGPPGPPRG